MLIYSLLHLTGYDLPISELQRFRQWGSKTPGHPENTHTHGVEMATGPLGQGIAHSVGMAIAERFLAATYNRPGHELINHYTYAICSDGDLMEGISSEAGSLAGHLQLGKLIWLYDDNGITIDGKTSIAFTENVGARFEAFGWHVQRVDGMDIDAVDAAIQAAQGVTDKPSLIMCKTVIGFGSPNRAGTSKVHGAPLGPDELKLTKEALGIPLEPTFYVPDEVRAEMGRAVAKGQARVEDWNQRWAAYQLEYPMEAKHLSEAMNHELPAQLVNAWPELPGNEATRKSGQRVLEAIQGVLPNLIGGSADLVESTYTHQDKSPDFQPDSPSGKNVCFGIREHAMCAAVNGMTLHGGVRAYGSSFFVFTDYARPSIRLAALMKCPSIFVFTHDSIGVGEDGPTHQPIEHLMSLRAMPNLNTFRPCDGPETSVAWKVALEAKDFPSMIVLSRQALPQVSPKDVEAHPAHRGAYILAEASGGTPKVILIGSGSEVQHCLGAKEALEVQGIPTRVVSMPSWFLFERQDPDYRSTVFPQGVKRVSIEAGAVLGWERYADRSIGMTTFGASAPAGEVMKNFGFTAENLATVAKSLIE
jgi:transketolase